MRIGVSQRPAAVVVLASFSYEDAPLYKLADVDTSIQEQPYSTTDDRAGF